MSNVILEEVTEFTPEQAEYIHNRALKIKLEVEIKEKQIELKNAEIFFERTKNANKKWAKYFQIGRIKKEIERLESELTKLKPAEVIE